MSGQQKLNKLEKIRQAVADYMDSEGCGCCERSEDHRNHKRILAELLKVPPYKDHSGYNFARFRSFENQ